MIRSAPYSMKLTLRLGLIMLTMVVLAWLIVIGRHWAGVSVAFIILAAQTHALIGQVRRTNRELTRFLHAIRYSDFTHHFRVDGQGAAFDELGQSFNAVLQRFRTLRGEKEEQARYLEVVLEHVPIALVSTREDGSLDLLNNAARKMFGTAELRWISDLTAFGEQFQQDMARLRTGERRVSRIRVQEETVAVAMAVSELRICGASERLFSLQSIQSEMEAVELQAWQSLVRVLTHEIMNSLTPVSSLSKTAGTILADARELDPSSTDYGTLLDDVEKALQTMAKRSGGLMTFIQNYRKITRLPDPVVKVMSLAEVFSSIETLVGAHWQEQSVSLSFQVTPSSLEVTADPEMLEQALINIVKNAAEATEEQQDGQVGMEAYLNPLGQVVIDVIDNGSGFDEADLKDVFVPFFTSKKNGSGVGLALVRQIMLAHGGMVSARNRDEGGALVRMTFR